jgi:DNA mismatch endonuclease (patch repair protein)
MAKIETLGWSVAVVWQCEMRDTAALVERLLEFLGPPPHSKRCTPNTALTPYSPLVVG